MNERHPLDIISLIFGVLFVGLAVPVLLLDTQLRIDVRWALPATVIVIGVLLLWSALRPGRKRVTNVETAIDEDR